MRQSTPTQDSTGTLGLIFASLSSTLLFYSFVSLHQTRPVERPLGLPTTVFIGLSWNARNDITSLWRSEVGVCNRRQKLTCDVGKVQTWVLFLNAAPQSLDLPPCFTAARLLAATLYFVFSTGRLLLLLLSLFSLWAGCTLMAWLCVKRATAEHYRGGYHGFMILRCW